LSVSGVPFVKMHGLGNDYVYVDVAATGFDLARAAAFARAVSPRRTSIGSDGAIFLGPSDRADARMHMYNADGSRGKMCGNGARCAARLVAERLGKDRVVLETDAGLRAASLVRDSVGAVRSVVLDAGEPALEPERIPCRATRPMIDAPLPLPGCGGPLAPRVTCVSMGNPHAVIFTEDPATAPVGVLGPEIGALPFFPEGVNVEFVRAEGPKRAVMRVYERGSGETAACGTGACAVVVAGVLVGRFARDVAVTVAMPGGAARVTWTSAGNVLLEGEACEAFRGEVDF
jgi:diaminopimelate epimerase